MFATDNEAYIRLIEGANISWQDRAHFFAVVARLMRRILVDAARAKVSAKRGGKRSRVNLNEIPDFSSGREIELIAIDHALVALARVDVRKAQIVEMRFFGGLSVEETAEVLKTSAHTVMRNWKLAKAWLMVELSNDREH